MRDLICGNVLAAHYLRLGERSVDCDVVCELLSATLEHHDDGVHASTGLDVEVTIEHLTLAGLHVDDLSEGDVLLERCAQRVDPIGERCCCLCTLFGDLGSDFVHDRDELLGLRHKVGLAPQLDDSAGVTIAHRRHSSLRGIAIRALCGTSEPLLA